MKILLLTDGIYPYTTGGMQKHSYYLTKYLLMQGHHVTLVYCVGNPVNRVKNVFNEKDSDRLTEIVLEFPSIVKFPGHYILSSYLYSKSIYTQIQTRLASFDHIYIQGFSGWYTLKKLHKNNQKVNTIVNFHGLEMFQLNVGFKARLQAAVLRYFTKKNLTRARFVQSLGGKLTVILKTRVGIKDSNIMEVPIGIERKWVSTGQLSVQPLRQLVFIGRNEPRKGFPGLQKVLDAIGNKYDYHLHVIGPFKTKNSATITFHGLIRNEDDIIKILDGCDVLICPSHAEGMPTVILEAMSRGCAIAASDVGAVACEVDESNGWLFEAGNEQQLTACIENILCTEKAVLISKKEHSRSKIISSFLWDNLPEKMFKTA